MEREKYSIVQIAGFYRRILRDTLKEMKDEYLKDPDSHSSIIK